MTWTAAQAPTAESTATAAGTTITATFPAATTAGNLLTIELGSSGSGTWSLPAGWVEAQSVPNGATQSSIWYYPNNPGGITTVVCTLSVSGNLKAGVGEWHTDVAGATVVVNAVGTGTAGAVASCPVSTGTAAAAGDLAIGAWTEHLTSSLAVTWTQPSGWVTAANDTAAAGNHLYSAYQLSAAAGTLSATGTSNTASTSANGWTGVIVTFTAQAGAPPAAAWVLTQKSASQGSTGSGTTVTATLPAASTGTVTRPHLVAAYLMSVTAGTWTVPAGWSQAADEPNGSGAHTTILTKVDTTGSVGMSTVFTFSATANLKCWLAEYDPGADGLTITQRTKGTGLAGAVTTCPVTTDGVAAAGDLALGGWTEHFSAGTAITWTTPTGGWVTVGSDFASTGGNHQYAAHLLSAPSGAVTATGKSSVASTLASGWAGVLAVFTVTATGGGAPGTAGLVGTYLNPGKYGTGVTMAQAVSDWQANSGRQLTVQRFYWGPDSIPTWPQTDLKAAADAGRKACMSFKPAFSPTSTSQLTALDSFLSAASAYGLKADVALWHEPYYSGSGITPAQLKAVFQFYGPTVRQYYRLFFVTSAGSVWFNNENSWYPGDANCDAVATDFYCSAYVQGIRLGGGGTTDPAFPADNASPPKPFGIWESMISLDATQGQTKAQGTAYVNHQLSYFTGRLSAGKTNADILWFNSDTNLKQETPVVTADGGTSTWSSTPEYRNALFDSLFDSLNAVTAPGPPPVLLASEIDVSIEMQTSLTAGQVTALPPPAAVTADLSFPTLRVEIGVSTAAPAVPAGTFILDDPVYGKLGTGRLGAATSWVDIAAYFRSGTLTRPSTRQQGPLLTYEAGTASDVILDNSGGGFDPDNPASPYVVSGVTALRAMMPLRFRAEFGSVSYPLLYAFTDNWGTPEVTYDAGYAEVSVSATDGLKILEGRTITKVSDPVGDQDTSGARVRRILDAAGWFTDHRAVSGGNSAVQATTYGDTALALLQLTADSEIGELYVDGAGNLVFRARHDILTDPRSATVQAVFGDLPGTVQAAGTELPYASLGRANDDTTLANVVQITTAGGTPQEASSAASIATYLFPRTWTRDGIILAGDTDALSYAQWVLAVSLDADDRFETLTIDPAADPANLFPQVLGREIGDRIQVWRRPYALAAPIVRDCFIRGITHDIDAVAGTWVTTWALQDATRYAGFLILDDAAHGLLNAAKLAF